MNPFSGRFLVAILLASRILFTGTGTASALDSDRGPEKVTLIVHLPKQMLQNARSGGMTELQVWEHGERLVIAEGPRSAGAKQIAIVLDANVHQKNVLPLEKQTAERLIRDFSDQEARGTVVTYGAQLRSSGRLTDDWSSLRTFNSEIAADTDKDSQSILMFDAIKKAIDTLGASSGTKAVVLLAEGNDAGSMVGWKSVAKLAEHNHTAVYVVLFADHTFYGVKGIRHYGWDLIELAPKTGGKFWEVGGNTEKAEKVIQEIELEVETQGLLDVIGHKGLRDSFHSVKIKLSGRSVPAQTGYF